jgi:hypothetical protein
MTMTTIKTGNNKNCRTANKMYECEIGMCIDSEANTRNCDVMF